MQNVLLVLIGFLLAGYFVLEGLHLGVGLLLPAFGGQAGRDAAVRMIAPMFLGAEVWLVAAAGTMLGAFPQLDAALIGGRHPAFVTLLVAWALRDAGLWLRRQGGATARARWDRVIAAASAGLAFTWGVILADLASGGRGIGRLRLLEPFPLLGGVLLVALCAAHGAAVGALRLPAPARGRAARLARPLVAGAAGLFVLTAFVAWAATGAPSHLHGTGLLITAAALGAVALCGLGAARRYLATAAGVSAPILLAGAGAYPHLPVDGLPVADAAAGGATPAFIAAVVLPLLPMILGFQVWLWRWAWRPAPDRPFF